MHGACVSTLAPTSVGHKCMCVCIRAAHTAGVYKRYYLFKRQFDFFCVCPARMHGLYAKGASQKGGRFACTLGISPVYAKICGASSGASAIN